MVKKSRKLQEMLRKWFFLMILASLLIYTNEGQNGDIAQVVVSNTPVRVVIPTSAPPATAGVTPTNVPPTFTPTPEGVPQLEARPEAGDVNVRSEPDLESEILGTIRSGDVYVITGRYYRWLQFRFDPSPTRLGYIFDELVIVTGDELRIPDLTEGGVPTQDVAIADATEQAAVLQQTPGFELTQAADARFIEAPGGDTLFFETTQEVDAPLVVLPTYTYPPNVVAQVVTATPEVEFTATPAPSGINFTATNGIAPIIPIVMLAGLGLIGLLLSLLRR